MLYFTKQSLIAGADLLKFYRINKSFHGNKIIDTADKKSEDVPGVEKIRDTGLNI